MSAPTDLPAHTQDETAHSARLVAHILDDIDGAGGWIGFARYMMLALYAPGLGYYSAGARKFGADGDFVTAPEVAPVFSRCLATQVSEVLAELGSHAVVLEPGAGSGAMAATLLAELERRGTLPREYWILEVSADLRGRQRDTLAAVLPHVLGRVPTLEPHPDPP
jgi:SAM-dependent MidA family methyltransferase